MREAGFAAAGPVALTTVAGLLRRAFAGRGRCGSGRRVRPAHVALPADDRGARGTLLQSPTASCTGRADPTCC